MNKLILLTSVAIIALGIVSESWAANCEWEDTAKTKLIITGSEGETFTSCSNGIKHKSATEVTFGAGITSIGKNAFYNAISLQSVDLPNVTSIAKYAFYGATSLKSVDMPNVTSIGSWAFYNADSLKSVDMPKITSIGYGAFEYAHSLSYAGFGQESVSMGDLAFDGTGISTCTGGASCGSCPDGQSVMPGRGCVADCGTGYSVDESTKRCVANTQTESQGQQGQGDSQASEQQGSQVSGQATSAADCAASGKYWQEGKCVSSCGASFKLNDGWCDRQRYTPAEATAVLTNDNNNSVIITFKK